MVGRSTRKLLPPPSGEALRVAAVALGDLAHQREAKPAAATGLGRAGQAIEGLEDPLALAFGHARPVIAHLDPGASVGGAADPHLGLRGAAAAAGVLEEIADHAAQQRRVAAHGRGLAFDADGVARRKSFRLISSMDDKCAVGVRHGAFAALQTSWLNNGRDIPLPRAAAQTTINASRSPRGTSRR
jgi:hypothetical protein